MSALWRMQESVKKFFQMEKNERKMLAEKKFNWRGNGKCYKHFTAVIYNIAQVGY